MQQRPHYWYETSYQSSLDPMLGCADIKTKLIDDVINYLINEFAETNRNDLETESYKQFTLEISKNGCNGNVCTFLLRGFLNKDKPKAINAYGVNLFVDFGYTDKFPDNLKPETPLGNLLFQLVQKIIGLGFPCHGCELRFEKGHGSSLGNSIG